MKTPSTFHESTPGEKPAGAPVSAGWTRGERAVFRRLDSPPKIQRFIDSLRYSTDDRTRSPRGVIDTGKAHCFDGALFGAAALAECGFPPLVIDLRANEHDDDHVLAVYRTHGRWGAIGKSNYTSCRDREPVFRSIRELVLSYFHIYFNLTGRRTLREFSLPWDLDTVRGVAWRFTGEDLSFLGAALDGRRHFPLITPRTERILSRADDRLFRGETLGLDPAGAFKVRGSRLKL